MLPSNMRGFDRFPPGQAGSASGMQAAAAASAAGVASGSSHFQQEMQAAGQPQPPTVTPFSFQDPESQVGVFASVFFALALLKILFARFSRFFYVLPDH